MTTYRITSIMLINDPLALVKAVFPSHDGEPMSADHMEVLITFATEQTPADLGPLVKVERVTDISTLP